MHKALLALKLLGKQEAARKLWNHINSNELPTQYKLLCKQAKGRHFKMMLKILLCIHSATRVGRSLWEHNGQNRVFYSREEWTHSANRIFSFQQQMLDIIIFDQWTQWSFSILHSTAHGNISNKQPSENEQNQLGCRWFKGAGVSPGGVHASTEDWTSTDRLLEGMGIFLSLYFAKAAWTASVCRSKKRINSA